MVRMYQRGYSEEEIAFIVKRDKKEVIEILEKRKQPAL